MEQLENIEKQFKQTLNETKVRRSQTTDFNQRLTLTGKIEGLNKALQILRSVSAPTGTDFQENEGN